MTPSSIGPLSAIWSSDTLSAFLLDDGRLVTSETVLGDAPGGPGVRILRERGGATLIEMAVSGTTPRMVLSRDAAWIAASGNRGAIDVWSVT